MTKYIGIIGLKYYNISKSLLQKYKGSQFLTWSLINNNIFMYIIHIILITINYYYMISIV